MKLGVVIPAAGRGKRMETELNKQFLQIGNRPVLAHTIGVFFEHPDIDEIIIVVRDFEKSYCQKNLINKYGFDNVKLVAGGKTRRESVYAGLMAFSPAINYVIIHDGARPLIEKKIINRVIKALENHDAISLGVRVKDTIKLVNQDNFALKTLERSELVAIQTPQAFKLDLIKRAHQKVKMENASDDASLVETLGAQVKIIWGSYENIKITTPFDLACARTIMESRGE